MKNETKIINLSIMQIFYDDDTLLNLLNNLITKSPIEILYLVPFLSLFCVESVNFFAEQKINIKTNFNSEFNEKKIRIKLKCFEDKFLQSEKIVKNCDLLQDSFFRNKIKCNLIKKLNLYYNLGCYIVDGKIIGNTQYAYYIFQDSKLLRKKEIGLEDGQFDIIPKELKNYGAHCGNLVLIINELCKILTKQNYLNKVSQYNHIIYYKDFNTNKLFKKDKTLKLYLLHILSNINYVYYVLRKYEVKDTGWWLKIYYITYYYAIVRIESIKEYISTQKQSKSYLNSLFNITNKVSTEINRNFRSCMMHYKFINPNSGDILIEEKYFDIQIPLFGLVESMFDGMTYEELKLKILHNLKIISDELEIILNIDLNHSKKLEGDWKYE